MDASEEFAYDDLFLDDETLLVLEQEEQKFQEEQKCQEEQKYRAQTAQQLTELPPPKRQKSDNGWRAVDGNQRASTVQLDELPEIALQGDGSYGFGRRARRILSPAQQPSTVSDVPTVGAVYPVTPQSPSRPALSSVGNHQRLKSPAQTLLPIGQTSRNGPNSPVLNFSARPQSLPVSSIPSAAETGSQQPAALEHDLRLQLEGVSLMYRAILRI